MTDGVIKYNFHFTPTAPLPKTAWEEIEAVRERLFAMKLIGEKAQIGYGNISRRIDNERFIITGTQTGHLPNLTAEHYAQIDAWNDETFTIHSSGATKPSSEALTHATIYNLSPDIKAVIHIHSKTIWNFMLNHHYPQTADVPYGSREMIEAVKALYRHQNPLHEPKFVMKGHEEGVMTFGRDLREAEVVLYGIVGEMLEISSNQA